MSKKISICIPTWEQHGYGVIFLEELFNTIKKQTNKNFNVIISDHSLDDKIFNLTVKYRSFFEILYFKNPNKRGNGPANTNECIKKANGDIIKIMFQDDLFFSDRALEIIGGSFKKNNCEWLVSGCNHTVNGKTFNREMVPSWNDRILDGINTISSPSVLAFKNDKNVLLFDEELIMLMDCEYYYQLYKKYGLPFIVKDTLISNRIHKHQISSMYNKNIKEEITYVKNKHYAN
jgi:glycosyltransferase involved in cell wall biosynthesis